MGAGMATTEEWLEGARLRTLPAAVAPVPVSYTHLTLPTIYSV